MYYSYLPSSQLKGFFLHLYHENTQECLLEHYSLGLVLLQVNSNFSVDLDTKWQKRNLDMLDSLIQEVKEFYDNWTKRLDDITAKHKEEQRLQAKKKK